MSRHPPKKGIGPPHLDSCRVTREAHNEAPKDAPKEAKGFERSPRKPLVSPGLRVKPYEPLRAKLRHRPTAPRRYQTPHEAIRDALRRPPCSRVALYPPSHERRSERLRTPPRTPPSSERPREDRRGEMARGSVGQPLVILTQKSIPP